MNLDKFTDRAKGFLQAAQTVAIRMNHQRIAPEHLLKALLEDEQGMASGLIARAGGQAAVALRETDAALARIPQVSGAGASAPPGGGPAHPCCCTAHRPGPRRTARPAAPRCARDAAAVSR